MAVERRGVAQARVGLDEVFGLRPIGLSLSQCKLALLGDGTAPASRWGPSSLRILKPWISVPSWLGWTRADRRALIYNLPNRTPQDPEAGYSVRVSDCRDFRGRQLTYDGHVGTDFVCPPGTRICAAAAGVVRGSVLEMQRGGRKLYLDHGAGLGTTYSHLSRALVEPGQRVARGEVIGLSGMSGVDGVLFNALLAPHLHFNALLNGDAADPWAKPGETSLWLHPNDPRPWDGAPDAAIPRSEWDEDAVEKGIAACRDAETRARLRAHLDLDARAHHLTIERVFRPFLFASAHPLGWHPRQPRLSMPFHPADFAGAVLADEVGPAVLRALAGGGDAR